MQKLIHIWKTAQSLGDSGPPLNNYLPLTLVVSQPSYIDAYAFCQGKN